MHKRAAALTVALLATHGQAQAQIDLFGSEALVARPGYGAYQNELFSPIEWCLPPASELEYLGSGSRMGERAMASSTASQGIAPMSRFLDIETTCSASGGGADAEGLLFALDGVGVVRSEASMDPIDPCSRLATDIALTVSDVKTKEGTSVVSSSERRLSPAQRAQLRKGEVEGAGKGHAEVTAVEAAKARGLTPTEVGASRPICPNCQETLRKEGVGF